MCKVVYTYMYNFHMQATRFRAAKLLENALPVNTTLTIHDNLYYIDESYFSQFKLCQNVLVTNTATEKLMDPLSKSNISVNAGIFRYTLDNFGNVTEWIEFYKTKGISSTLQIKSKSQLDEKYVWKRRSNLFGVNFNAISS